MNGNAFFVGWPSCGYLLNGVLYQTKNGLFTKIPKSYQQADLLCLSGLVFGVR